jgi:D-sedoheptulose 7-phosphate isomerase
VEVKKPALPGNADPASDERCVSHVRAIFERSANLKKDVSEHHAETLVTMARAMARSLNGGGKVLFCGNGGSAADAQHLAAELLIRLRPEANRIPLPALSLALDVSSLTACANDYDYDSYFERLVHALGRSGDVLVGISTSGRSMSVVRALRAARGKQMLTVGLLGGEGEPALSECDLAVLVPSSETGRVQECHITAGHAMMELVEAFCCDYSI